MSFLQKTIEQKTKPDDQTAFFDLFKDTPFWIWDKKEHLRRYETSKPKEGMCCFNHIIGLPDKNGYKLPLFDYEKLVIDAMEQIVEEDSAKNKHVYVKKATGLGITELMLRYMAWLCLRDNMLAGSKMCIITGPRVDLAISLIKRLKIMFMFSPTLTKLKLPAVKFDEKETQIDINHVLIEAFPSHLGLDSARGIPDASFFLLDEADFFPKGKQDDARAIPERYIGKSDPVIAIVSTPKAPKGLMEKIETEAEDKCIYRRLFLDYRYGLNRIYTEEDIKKAKASPSFEQEYNLQYLGLIGNLFSIHTLDRVKELGSTINVNEVNVSTPKSIGVDPGFGSSNTGIVVTELGADDKVHVIFAEEYERPMFQDMVNLVMNLKETLGNVEQIFIDGNNPEFITAVKLQLGERIDYQEELSSMEKRGLDIYQWGPLTLPVSFAQRHKEMLGRVKHMMDNEVLYINPKFDKLLIACRTAVVYGETLDKNETSFNDVFDALRLSLENYKFY